MKGRSRGIRERIPSAKTLMDALPLFTLLGDGAPVASGSWSQVTGSGVPSLGSPGYATGLTASMPRMLHSPRIYAEALAELWMGDRRNGLDELSDYYLQRVLQLDSLKSGDR